MPFSQVSAEAVQAATTTVNQSYPLATSSASFLLAHGLTNTSGTLSVTDGHSNSWAQIGGYTTSNGKKCGVFWAQNTSGGALTVTLTCTASGTMGLFVAEYTGNKLGSPIDNSLGMNAIALTTSVSLGTLTLNQSNEMLITIGRQTSSLTGGYVATDGSTLRSASNSAPILFDRNVNAGTYTATFTQNSDTDSLLIVGVLTTSSSSGSSATFDFLFQGKLYVTRIVSGL